MSKTEIGAMDDPDFCRGTEGAFWAKEAASSRHVEPPYFRHERSCLQPGGGESDDECICSRSHIRKENKRLGRPTPLPTNVFREAGSPNASSDPRGHVFQIRDNSDSMDALRLMFPNGQADHENWVLFSTSGTHGTRATIEEVEKELQDNGFTFDGLTYVIVHPRIVSMKYGRAYPETLDDISFLKKLRESSIKAVSTIGQPRDHHEVHASATSTSA